MHTKNANGSLERVGSALDVDDYKCLIFDCDKQLLNDLDLKARSDYFRLLSNLTNRVTSPPISTIYVPGEGNPHLIVNNPNFCPTWSFLLSSGESSM